MFIDTIERMHLNIILFYKYLIVLIKVCANFYVKRMIPIHCGSQWLARVPTLH